MHRGYIKIWRRVKDSGLYQLPNAFTLFVYMLNEAAYKPVRFGTVELDRGQLVTGRHKLSAELQMSERCIRTAIDHLEKLDFISSKATNKYTVYTIVNYGKYQDSDAPTDQENDQQKTNERPTKDQQPTTNKESNKVISKEVIHTPRKSSLSKLLERGVDETIAKDWLIIRKAKRLPLTDTSINQVENEAKIAGLSFADAVAVAVRNTWAGYKAKWEDKSSVTAKTTYDQESFMKSIGANK